MSIRSWVIRSWVIRSWALRILAVVVAAWIGLISPTTALAAPSWKIEDVTSTGQSGVSPHVERTADGDLLFRSDGPSGTVASLCRAFQCSPVAFTSGGGPVNDFTVATLPNGSKRGYFVDVNPNTGMKTVSSAPCLDAACLAIGARTPINPEASVPMTTKAWGVPDAVVLPDGRVRIYMVESPVPGRCTEKIASYISSDGVAFTKEPGWRLENGYVDTEVLRAKDGAWVMILADIGCTADGNQKLFVSESADGLAWSKPQVLTGAGTSKLDPTGYEVSDNVFRIYYATSGSSPGQFGSIEGATLVLGKASKTISCKKGSKIIKVTGTKCPRGTKLVR